MFVAEELWRSADLARHRVREKLAEWQKKQNI